MARSTWNRVGRLIVHAPHFRADRGSWFVRLRDVENGETKKVRLALADPRAAKQAMAAALEAAKEILRLDARAATPTFAAVLPLFLEDKKRSLRDESFEDLRDYLTKVFLPELGRRKLDTVRPAELHRIIAEVGLQKEARSGRTQTKLKAHIGQLFRWAIDNHYATENPAQRVKVRARNSAPVRVALDEKEANHLLEIVHGEAVVMSGKRNAADGTRTWTQRIERSPDLAMFLVLTFFTALRPGAVTRIAWRHFDFTSRIIHIPPEAMKTGLALDLPMAAPLAAYLWAWKGKDKDLVVKASHNALLLALRRATKRLAKEIAPQDPRRSEEIKKANLRIGRYSAASFLASRVPLNVIQFVLGHSSRSAGGIMTARYMVPAFEDVRAALEALPWRIPGAVVKNEGQAVQ